MKLIIAGSRSVTSYSTLTAAISLTPFPAFISAIVSGNARGVDLLGEQFACTHRLPVEIFPAQWDTLGMKAGFIRNAQMAAHADALLALWDGHSNGTLHMFKCMATLHKPRILLTVCTGTAMNQSLTGDLHHLSLYPILRPADAYTITTPIVKE